MSANPTTFLRQENARLTAENEELREEVHSLREFVQILNSLQTASSRFQSDDELLPFLKGTLTHVLKLVNAPDGSLALLDDETHELVFVIVHGVLSEQLTNYRMASDEGIMGWVIKHEKAALVRDVRSDFRFSHLIDDTFKYRTQSILAVPLIGNQKIFGVVEVLNQPGDNPFSDQDVDLVTLVCRAAGEALADIERMGPTE